MKIILFCEGQTERSALPAFLHRWLDSKLPARIGVKPVRFNGWSEFEKEVKKKAALFARDSDVAAVVGLVDLYGPTFYPPGCVDAQARYQWGKRHFENLVGQSKFRQHFAVHELEAWILSQPSILPAGVANRLPGKASHPETVNFDEPPSKLLNNLYRQATDRGYKKTTYGDELFRKLQPEIVYEKCPFFRAFADDLVALGRAALESS